MHFKWEVFNMKRKSIIKHGFILCLVTLFSMNLTACNNTNKEIEVGFDSIHTTCVTSMWLEFHTGAKVKIQKAKTKYIEVFYGNWLAPDISKYGEICGNQKLEFKLTRYVYSSEYDAMHNDATHNLFKKSEVILAFKNTFQYFFSDDFEYLKNSMIDTIEAKDLVQDYGECGVLSYKFTITPIENETLKLFDYAYPYDNINELRKIYSDDTIRSYYNCFLKYKIKCHDKIAFIKN